MYYQLMMIAEAAVIVAIAVIVEKLINKEKREN